MRAFPVAERIDQLIAFACFPSLANYTSDTASLASLRYFRHHAYSLYTKLFKDLLSIEPLKVKSCSESFRTARILIIAPVEIPTVQLSFFKPLGQCNNPVEYLLWTDADFKGFSKAVPKQERINYLDAHFNRFLTEYEPTCLILCRCFHADIAILIKNARALGIPTIYHIDDDLLCPSLQILGSAKYKAHSDPERISSIRKYLGAVDLVYTSTQPLSDRLKSHGICNNFYSGKIYCSSSYVAHAAVSSPSKRIGYMGFGHAADLELIINPLRHIMKRNVDVVLELFGTIELPLQLQEFEERIVIHGPIRTYDEFLKFLKSREWLFGLAPLVNEPFNLVKANTKWVEYTSCDIVTIASNIQVYNECCADECGVLCMNDEEWISAMQSLLDSPDRRNCIMQNAQIKILQEYSLEQHQRQILETVQFAREIVNGVAR
jgi:glycosyltransferase involved in cell wall biosynthesis